MEREKEKEEKNNNNGSVKNKSFTNFHCAPDDVKEFTTTRTTITTANKKQKVG